MSFWPYEVHTMDCALEHLTDVKRSFSREKRTQLRATPRLAMSLTARVYNEEIRRTKEIVEASHGRVKVPDWRYQYRVIGEGVTFPFDAVGASLEVDDEVVLAKNKERVLTTITEVNEDDGTITVAVNHLKNFILMPCVELVLTTEPTITPTGGMSADVLISGVADKGEFSEAPEASFPDDAKVFITMDYSGSMTVTRKASQRNAIINLLQGMRDAGTFVGHIKIVFFSSSVGPSISRSVPSEDDYNAMISWLETTDFEGGTSFYHAVYDAPTFFNGLPEEGENLIILTTDGETSNGDVSLAKTRLAAINDGAKVFCFNIDQPNTEFTMQIDNTPSDGVPVVSGDSSIYLYQSIMYAIATSSDTIDAPVFEGAIVANKRDVIGSPTSKVYVAESIFDEGIGVITMVPTQQDTESFSTISMIADTVLEAYQLEKFFLFLKGRLRSFWKPSWFSDYRIVSSYPEGASNLTFTDISSQVEALAIELKTGRISYHKVTSITGSSVSISPPLGFPIAPDTLRSISKMELHRLDSDVVNFRFAAPYSVEVSVPTIKVSE